MWISGGDHEATENIVHLVLAKVPDAEGEIPTGTKGISLFIVPKVLPDGQRNDVAVAGLNHKMGYRGLPNCALNFGEGRYTPDGKAGAVGWIVGEPGRGLPQMFQDDERGADLSRPGGDDAWLPGLSDGTRLRAGANARQVAGNGRRPADTDHRTCRCFAACF